MDQQRLVFETGRSIYTEFLGRVSMYPGVPRATIPDYATDVSPRAITIGWRPVNAIWASEIKPEIKRILNKEAVDWSFFTATRFSYMLMPEEYCPVTVLISVRENAVDRDRVVCVLQAVADCVYRSDRFQDVVIEIAEGGLALHNHREYLCGLGYAFEHAFVEKPLLGASLGVEGMKGSAILGGYMVIRVQPQGSGEPHIFNVARSCHHVFTDGAAAIPLSTEESRPTFDCPSKDDVRLPRTRTEAGEKGAAEMLKAFDEDLRRLREELNTAGTFNTKFGKIFATSGIKKDSGYILDSGLGLLDKSRFSDSDGISSALGSDTIRQLMYYDLDYSSHLTSEGGVVPVSELERRREHGTYQQRAVFKCGRTTRQTRGELNQIPATININMHHGPDNEATIVTGDAMLILAPTDGCVRPWMRYSGQNIAFGDAGDSGSLVYDYQGKVAGTYVGGQLGDDVAVRNRRLVRGLVPPATDDDYLRLSIKKASVGGLHFVAPAEIALNDIRIIIKDTFPEADHVEVAFRLGEDVQVARGVTLEGEDGDVGNEWASSGPAATVWSFFGARGYSLERGACGLWERQWLYHLSLVYPADVIRGIREMSSDGGSAWAGQGI